MYRSIRGQKEDPQTPLLYNCLIRFLAASAASFLYCLSGTAVYAQAAPTEIPPLELPQPPRSPVEPPQPLDELRISPEVAPPIDFPLEQSPSNELSQTADRVFVSGYRFIGNSVFSSEQLLSISAPYLNREVTFLELAELQARITELYVQNGYITSRAFISTNENQNFDPESAEIVFSVLEGKVEEITVGGAPRLENYVRDRLRDSPSPLNLPKLEEALRLLRIDPLIQAISAELSAGANDVSSVLRLDVEASPPFDLNISTNNRRSSLAGSLEQRVEFQASNLLSLGESVTLDYALTEGSDQYRLAFSLPLNANDGKLSIEYIGFNSRIVQEPFNVFDIKSQNYSYQVAYQQPIIQAATDSQIETLILGLSATRLESSSTVEGFPFPLSPGADENGQTRITELGFIQEYQKRTGRGLTLARSEFGFGVDFPGNNSTEGELDGEYFLWRGQAAWLRQVGRNRLLVQGEVQLTGDELVPLSQFSVGGLKSAQGFRQLSLLSDNGLTSSVEFQVPIARNPVELNLIAFFEAGIGWNNGRDRTIRNDLFLVPGLGVQMNLGGLNAQGYYAFPLTNLEEQSGSRLGFQIGYQALF